MLQQEIEHLNDRVFAMHMDLKHVYEQLMILNALILLNIRVSAKMIDNGQLSKILDEYQEIMKNANNAAPQIEGIPIYLKGEIVMKEKMTKVLKKIDDAACKGIMWTMDHSVQIVYGAAVIGVVGLMVYLKGLRDGIRQRSLEWDFTNDQRGDVAVILDEDGELRSCVPKSVLAEIMESHHIKEWTNDMWRKLD